VRVVMHIACCILLLAGCDNDKQQVPQTESPSSILKHVDEEKLSSPKERPLVLRQSVSAAQRPRWDCMVEQVIGSEHDGLHIQASCDGRSLRATRRYDGPGEVAFSFEAEAELSGSQRLVFVEGRCEPVEKSYDGALPVFVWNGQKYTTVAEAWILDPQTRVAISPSGKRVLAVAVGEMREKPSKALWAVYTTSCPEGENECVVFGDAQLVCRATLAKADLRQGYSPEHPREWAFPSGCM
jgi:hypothetical protein